MQLVGEGSASDILMFLSAQSCCDTIFYSPGWTTTSCMDLFEA